MLTIEELKTLPKDDFIWLVKIKQPKLSCYCSNLSFTPKLFNALGNKHVWYCLRIEDYGTKWLAYRNKEEAEGYYDQIRKETAKEILQELLCFVGSNQKFCIVDDNHKNLIEVDGVFTTIEKIAKKYGGKKL